MTYLIATVLTFLTNITPHPACEAAAVRLTAYSEAVQVARVTICSLVVNQAEQRGLPPALVAELSWAESRWTLHAENTRTKCWGPLQVQPYFWCPDKKKGGCDPVKAGLDALATYLALYPKSQEEAICHFQAGNTCTPGGRRGAKRVLHMTARLKARLAERVPKPVAILDLKRWGQGT
ncbi:MAG: hypothetical protein A2Y38_08100 [Spirochaetes bacterium GWB1_59_5]|nr:MAG: hypothetical protein A2Y38_08100 [Spirochaetes bacterium GWB1_59_5]